MKKTLKSQFKKLIATVLTLVMTLCLVPYIGISVSAANEVSYLSPIYVDSSDVTKGIEGWETKTVTSYEKLTSKYKSYFGFDKEVELSGWYVVEGDVTLERCLVCKGSVNIVLLNNCNLRIQRLSYDLAAIQCDEGSSLTIYAQSTDTNVMGKLTAKGGKYSAGIGKSNLSGSGNGHITINGGYINATGGQSGAGIGGCESYSGSNITINGGYVVASGGGRAAGIGGGEDGSGHDITINGGHVEAISYSGWFKGGAGIGGGDNGSGYNITINGGDVFADASSGSIGGGAGIGGGPSEVGHNIKITGGLVRAHGRGGGAGIGGGYNKNGYGIVIDGGEVFAYGHKGGAGIGGGLAESGSEISINGGYVVAEGGTLDKTQGGAGIGGGDLDDGRNIRITGGTVKATGAYNGAGIGGGSLDGNARNIVISGGIVTAYGRGGGAGIGGGNDEGTLESIKISGGKVYARCGTDSSNANGGAGIGGGDNGSAQIIEITGGIIEAHGGFEAAGIGGGRGEDCETVTISHATVKAYGSKCSGIGRGYGGGCKTVKITSSEVTAKSVGDAENHALGVNTNYDGGIFVSKDCLIYSGGKFIMYGNGNKSIIDSVYGDSELYINCPVVQAVNPADNTEAKYYTFDEYIKACSGCNLYLLKDIAISKLNLPKEGVTYTLYSNGYTLYDNDGNVLLGKGDTMEIVGNSDKITYYPNGIEKTVSATQITSNITAWTSGDYYVKDKVDINDSVTVSGNVKLILCDGCELTVNGSTSSAGIRVTNTDSLEIYAQSEGTGKLIAIGGSKGAGIGGNSGQCGGNITIYGGNITAQGGEKGAGIGGGCDGTAENIIINGGDVTAIGGQYAAGIGGGMQDNGLSVSSSGITVFGGNVKAVGGENAAAIGGGQYQGAENIYLEGGRITIEGGIYAVGSVGAGRYGTSGNIYVSDTMRVIQTYGSESMLGLGRTTPVDRVIFMKYQYLTVEEIPDSEVTTNLTAEANGLNTASVFSETNIWFMLGGVVILAAAIVVVIVVRKKKTGGNENE